MVADTPPRKVLRNSTVFDGGGELFFKCKSIICLFDESFCVLCCCYVSEPWQLSSDAKYSKVKRAAKRLRATCCGRPLRHLRLNAVVLQKHIYRYICIILECIQLVFV